MALSPEAQAWQEQRDVLLRKRMTQSLPALRRHAVALGTMSRVEGFDYGIVPEIASMLTKIIQPTGDSKQLEYVAFLVVLYHQNPNNPHNVSLNLSEEALTFLTAAFQSEISSITEKVLDERQKDDLEEELASTARAFGIEVARREKTKPWSRFPSRYINPDYSR